MIPLAITVIKKFAKFNGCNYDAFVLYLKEYEWRYNHRYEDLSCLESFFYLVKSLFIYFTKVSR